MDNEITTILNNIIYCVVNINDKKEIINSSNDDLIKKLKLLNNKSFHTYKDLSNIDLFIRKFKIILEQLDKNKSKFNYIIFWLDYDNFCKFDYVDHIPDLLYYSLLLNKYPYEQYNSLLGLKNLKIQANDPVFMYFYRSVKRDTRVQDLLRSIFSREYQLNSNHPLLIAYRVIESYKDIMY